MRIAVAYDNGEIGLHFGHAEMFAVYDYDGNISFFGISRIDGFSCKYPYLSIDFCQNRVNRV